VREEGVTVSKDHGTFDSDTQIRIFRVDGLILISLVSQYHFPPSVSKPSGSRGSRER
jgi:hypothetical protein